MKWFQIKEQSAGTKRLLLTWYLYKIFGKKILDLIAFLVSFVTFLLASDIRGFSKKYFSVLQKQTGLKPTWKNVFRHIHSYSDSLTDKMLVFSGNFDADKIVFDNGQDKENIYADMAEKKGVFFICNHIGNVEVLQTLILQKDFDFKINVFMSSKQSQIFNGFLQTIKIDYPVILYNVEDIGLNTGIELKENLNRGDIVFIAGDRLAQDNDERNTKVKIFDRDILIPQGAFKLAKLMEVPVYFISAIKQGEKYRIYAEKQTSLKEKDLTQSYARFLEKSILVEPFQFFHFYDFFIDDDKSS